MRKPHPPITLLALSICITLPIVRLFAYATGANTGVQTPLGPAARSSKVDDATLRRAADQLESWILTANLSPCLRIDQIVTRDQAADAFLNGPHWTVFIRARCERDVWYDLERRFTDRTGVPVLQVLIAKMAHALRVSPSECDLTLEFSCHRISAFFRHDEFSQIASSSCLASSASTDLLYVPVGWPPGVGAIDTASGAKTVGDAIARVLASHFNARNAKLTCIESGELYWEYEVTAAKGNVVRNRKYWERLQLSFMYLHSKSKAELRAVIDGRYASGLVEPPNDGFVDMEPRYSMELDKFTRSLLTEIKRAIR